MLQTRIICHVNSSESRQIKMYHACGHVNPHDDGGDDHGHGVHDHGYGHDLPLHLHH